MGPLVVDVLRADRLTPEVDAVLKDMFEYHPWDSGQVEKGARVRDALLVAVRAIFQCVPPGPDRSAAIRKIREARMDCNSAITHRGKY